MGSTADRIKGAGNKIAGMVKQGIGDATDNPELEAEGMAQEAKGHGQDALGKAKGAVKDAAHEVSKAANRNL
jgi:uncharacterized protein YjbJ (UPF0337 family)